MNKILSLTDIEPFLKDFGTSTFKIAGYNITFDLKNKHERAYAAKLLVNIRYPQSDIDTMLFKYFITNGDRVLDAGANIGFTSLEMVHFGASTVLAVEAVPDIYERLSALNCPRVITLNVAIAEQTGKAEMIISELHNQGSSYNPKLLEIFPSIFGNNPRIIEVPKLNLDTLTKDYGYFDVWKIDIEGAENDMLRGSVNTLNSHPPRVIIAEIFDDFLDEFINIVNRTHPYYYRVFLDVESYELRFLDVDAKPSEHHCHTSPMYVFLDAPV